MEFRIHGRVRNFSPRISFVMVGAAGAGCRLDDDENVGMRESSFLELNNDEFRHNCSKNLIACNHSEKFPFFPIKDAAEEIGTFSRSQSRKQRLGNFWPRWVTRHRDEIRGSPVLSRNRQSVVVLPGHISDAPSEGRRQNYATSELPCVEISSVYGIP